MSAVPRFAIDAVQQALKLLPSQMASREAVVMLYAIGLQESGFRLRRQMGNGPARGLWQFEKGGGVKGVCEHAASRYWMASLCEEFHIEFNVREVYTALEAHDVFAAGAARLLLFTDYAVLPVIGDVDAAWRLYLRTWRPGKPRPDTWAANYEAARLAVIA